MPTPNTNFFSFQMPQNAQNFMNIPSGGAAAAGGGGGGVGGLLSGLGNISPWGAAANVGGQLLNTAMQSMPKNTSVDPKINAEYWNTAIGKLGFQPMWENLDKQYTQAGGINDRFRTGMGGMLSTANFLQGQLGQGTADIRRSAGDVRGIANQIRGGGYLSSMDTGIEELRKYGQGLATGTNKTDQMLAYQQAEAEKRGMLAPGMTAAQREAANRQAREMGAVASYGERQGAYGQNVQNLANMRRGRSELELSGLGTAGGLMAQAGQLFATATGLDTQTATALAQIYQAYGTTGDPSADFLMQEIAWRTGILGQATGSKQRTTTGGS